MNTRNVGIGLLAAAVIGGGIWYFTKKATGGGTGSTLVNSYLAEIAAVPNTTAAGALLDAIIARAYADYQSGKMTYAQYSTIYDAYYAKWYATP